MPDTQIKDAVDQVRSAAQQRHQAISDAAAKRGGAVKADLQAVPQMGVGEGHAQLHRCSV
jgi:hypothetical protein